jgi:hypothetical protein
MKFDPDDITCQEIGEITFTELDEALAFAQYVIDDRKYMRKKDKHRMCFLLQFLRDALKEDKGKENENTN